MQFEARRQDGNPLAARMLGSFSGCRNRTVRRGAIFRLSGCKSGRNAVYLRHRLNRTNLLDFGSIRFFKGLEFRMRVPVAVLLAVALFGCAEKPAPAPVAVFVPPTPVPPTEHAAACVRPPEKAAFDVANLKSQLMVTAISCGGEDKYNAFVVRYRPELIGEEKSLNSFFGRAYGRRAQQEHDDFITQLANSQSQLSVKYGQNFCGANRPLLDDVMTSEERVGASGLCCVEADPAIPGGGRMPRDAHPGEGRRQAGAKEEVGFGLSVGMACKGAPRGAPFCCPRPGWMRRPASSTSGRKADPGGKRRKPRTSSGAFKRRTGLFGPVR